MNITDLLVSEDVEDKLYTKQRVSVDELYEVIWNNEDQLIIRHSQKVRGTYTAYGRTLAGRYLMLAFRLLDGGVAKILTARDMDTAERQLYRGQNYAEATSLPDRRGRGGILGHPQHG